MFICIFNKIELDRTNHIWYNKALGDPRRYGVHHLLFSFELRAVHHIKRSVEVNF
jgi:hypothetical protein